MGAKRISPSEAKQLMESDSKAFFVCAYESNEKFQRNHLEGAISFEEFQSREPSLSKDQAIIFYCA